MTDPADRIALRLNGRPKYVASTTPFEPTWPGTTVLTGDVAGQVAKLIQESGDEPILLVGSARLAQTLAAHDLVDEYQLMVHPVVLGSGKRLFGDRTGDRVDLRLVDSTTTEGGLVMNLLADGAGWRAAFQRAEETYRREGVGPGMQQFIATAVRTGGPYPKEDDADPPGQEQAPPMPDPSQLPPEVLEGMARMQANSEFLLAHLLPTTIGHVPDVARLRGVPSRIVVGVGAASQGQMPHLAALALAERLGSDAVEFPGDHQGFATHPGPFAETVHQVLRGS